MADLNIPYNNGNIESIYQQDKMGDNPSNPDSVPSANYLPISNNNSSRSGKNGQTYGIVPMYADKLEEDGELPSLSMDDNGVSANIINKPFITSNIFEMDYFNLVKMLELGKQIGVEINVMNEAVFSAMHRV